MRYMWHSTVKRLYQAVLLFGTGGFLIFMATATPVVLTSTDFSIYNAGWNGCSDLAVYTYHLGKLLPTLTYNKTTLTPVGKSVTRFHLDAPNTTILIIGPRTPFSSEEAAYIRQFLLDGGMLLLADDFGTGNTLLQQINASSRFSNALLLDLSFEKNASFVSIFTVHNSSHPLTENISGFLFNYPTSLHTGENTTVLASSSQLSWLDQNMNGKEDDNEPTGPFPVYAIESYGRGEIVLLSGPSILINSMATQLDNEKFRYQLLSYLFNGRDTVLFDESHRDVSLPLNMGYVFPSAISLSMKISILLLAMCVFLFLFTTIPTEFMNSFMKKIFPGRKTLLQQQSSLIDTVIEKHPSWDRGKLERIMKRIEQNEKT